MSSSLNCRSFQSSEHREELQCHVQEDTAEKRVTKIVKILLAEVRPYRAIDRGKSGAKLPSSCAHVQMERNRSSIWIVPTWEEQPKIESRGCADFRRVSG